MAEPARYTFLPWYRTGLGARAIKTEKDRAVVQVTLTVRSGTDPLPARPRAIQLFGPGDVLGIDPSAVVRTDPPDDRHGFEPNYLASIEFFDEDFAWRHSPGPPELRMAPWIALVALAEGEFRFEPPSGKAKCPRLVVHDVASLPPADQCWAWAHVHVSGAPPTEAGALQAWLARHPEAGVCRLLAARRLRPNTSYSAFVVPTFEAGRVAGLGESGGAAAPDGDADGGPYAWRQGQGQVDLPVYHRFGFRTGTEGDFESLAQALKPPQPQESLEGVGTRALSVAEPQPELRDLLPRIGRADGAGGEEALLTLGGALRVPVPQGAADDEWSVNRDAFGQALAGLLALGQAWKVDDGSWAVVDAPPLPGGVALPVVLPSVYGQWLAGLGACDPAEARTRWLEQVNLDPRRRVAAALGTAVVQQEQESLMARAWAQYGALFDANATRARAQFMREAARSIEHRHFRSLDGERWLAVTEPLHARVRAAEGAGPSVHGLVAGSTLPPAALQPAMRRLLRPGGPLARRTRLGDFAFTLVAGSVAAGEVAFNPRPTAPTDRPSVAGSGQAGPRDADADAWRAELAALLDHVMHLLPREPGLEPTRRHLEALLAELDRDPGLDPSRLASDAARAVRGPGGDELARWFRSLAEQAGGLRHEDLLPSPFDPESDALAHNFRQAAGNLGVWLGQPLPPEPQRPLLDVPALAARLRDALAPSHTFPAHVEARFPRPARLPGPRYDALDPIMPHPEFDDPTYLWLKALSQEHVAPRLGRLPNNRVVLLQTDDAAIESFLVGMNHEMARELLWRGYPTDRRGSCFRQFWGVRGVRGAVGEDGRIVEHFKDIHPVHGWRSPGGALTRLGGNRPIGSPPGSRLVLAVRGELLRRFPNTEVYAVRAVPNPPARQPEFGDLQNRQPGTERLDPVLHAEFDPDIRCFGFVLSPEEAVGRLEGGEGDLGWYFVFEERFGEPRFGLDDTPPGKELGPRPLSALDLRWGHLGPAGPQPGPPNVIDIVLHAPRRATLGEDKSFKIDDGESVTWAEDAASMAALMLQLPARVYFHAADLLPAREG